MLDVLKRDFAILHASTMDLSERTQRLGLILERVELLTTSMKQLSDSHNSSLGAPVMQLSAFSELGMCHTLFSCRDISTCLVSGHFASILTHTISMLQSALLHAVS